MAQKWKMSMTTAQQIFYLEENDKEKLHSKEFPKKEVVLSIFVSVSPVSDLIGC